MSRYLWAKVDDHPTYPAFWIRPLAAGDDPFLEAAQMQSARPEASPDLWTFWCGEAP